ncbi:TPA: fimbria/pilus outer membrane usher protein [Citrobacter freundii]
METLKLRYLCGALILSVGTAGSAQRYNTDFLNGISSGEFSDFVTSDNDVLPGTYYVNIYINGILVDSKEVTFLTDEKHGGLKPCITAEEYISYGLKISDDNQQCFALADSLPQVQQGIDIANHLLNYTIPQQFIEQHPRDYVSPKRFDDGINAAFVNYNYSADKNDGDWGSQNYQYLSLNSGINIGAWRLRNNAYWNKYSDQSDHWKSISSTAQTNIIPWRSRLIIGQTSTDSSIFDSIQFRGVQLGTDNAILPSSQMGYAPIIRGVANSNARVEIRQNKFLIYSENVPAGPFEISDIQSVNRSGDFYVTVVEADGSRNTFTVAYTSLPQLVRSGQWNYQISVGKYHDGADGYAPEFVQSTLSYGFNNAVTLYGGGLGAENYGAGVFGIGINMGDKGALSTDYTFASTVLANDNRKDGGSIRFLYAKSFLSSNTDFQIAGYRYSTAGYYSFSDAVVERRRWRNGVYKNYRWSDADNDYGWQENSPDVYYTSYFYNKKNRVDISARQMLGKHTSLFANFTQQKYWNSSGSDISIQTGLNSNIGKINYGIYYQNTRNHQTESDNSINLRVSIPFDFAEHKQVNASFDMRHSKLSGTSAQAGLNGSLLEDGRLSYAVSTGYDETSHSTNNASLGYQGQYGNVYGGYSYSTTNRQLSGSLSGGIIAHRGGVTLSQPLSETFTLVEAKEASGVGISNQPGVRIDPLGYAVVTSTIPYRVNSVSLNTQDFDTHLEVPNAVADTVPTRGAITRVKFDTFSGYSVLIHSTLPDGSYPPLGAQLFNSNGRNNGLVGPGGEIYVSGVEASETLRVKWGEEPDDSCYITLPAIIQNELNPMAYSELTLLCSTQITR